MHLIHWWRRKHRASVRHTTITVLKPKPLCVWPMEFQGKAALHKVRRKQKYWKTQCRSSPVASEPATSITRWDPLGFGHHESSVNFNPQSDLFQHLIESRHTHTTAIVVSEKRLLFCLRNLPSSRWWFCRSSLISTASPNPARLIFSDSLLSFWWELNLIPHC